MSWWTTAESPGVGALGRETMDVFGWLILLLVVLLLIGVLARIYWRRRRGGGVIATKEKP